MAIAIVATTAVNGATASVTTSAINTTGSNKLIVVASYYGSSTPTALTDSKGNSFTAVAISDTGANEVQYVWTCDNPVVGTGHTFTFGSTNSSNIYPNLSVLAASGCAASIVTATHAISTGATSLQAGGCTATANGSLFVAAINATNEPGAIAVDSGFTGVTLPKTSFGFSGGLAYKIQGTAGAENPAFSWATSQPANASLVAISPAATPPPSACTVTGPASTVVGQASTFTFALDNPAPSGGTSITPSATGFTATFGTSPVTIGAGQSSGTVAVTPTSAGAGSVTGTAPGITFTPASSTAAVAPSSATFTGPSSGTVGAASTAFTITLNTVALSGGQAITLSDGGAGGTFAGSGVSGSTLTIAAGQATGTFTYTPASSGSKTITPTATGVAFVQPSLSYTATTSAATAYTLTAPSPASGTVSAASAPFVLQANGTPTTTLVVTPTDGAGGTFTPASVSIATAGAFTFRYTPGTAGTKSISVTHTGGSGISGDPAAVAYTATPVPTGGQLLVTYPAASLTTVYFVIVQAPGRAWNGSAIEALNAAHWPGYAVAATDVAGAGLYFADFPAAVPAGTYTALAFVRAGSSPAPSDWPAIGEQTGYWDGSSFGAAGSTDLSPLLGLVTPGADGHVHPPASWLNAGAFATDTKVDGFMRAPSSGATLHFDAADATANGFAVGKVGQYLYIARGTGIGQTIPVGSASGTFGARDGLADTAPAFALDATSGYFWTGLPTAIASTGGGSGGSAASFDSGTVANSPAAPTPQGFWASGAGLLGASGDYTGMTANFTTPGKPARSRKVSAHSVVGGVHYFGLTWSGYPSLPSAPAVGDTFEVIP